MTGDICVNPNNSKVIEIAEKLGRNKHEIAAYIGLFQKRYGFIVPTVEQLYNFMVFGNEPVKEPRLQSIPIKGNEALYDRYNLLDKKGNIINVDKIPNANEWAKALNEGNNEHIVRVRVTPAGKQIVLFKKPTVKQELLFQNTQSISDEGKRASEKTIRDLAARMSDRIGIPVRFDSDRTKEYKGKIENGTAVVNLAYATLDTPIHEILGHPIIRAIKNGTELTDFKYNIKELNDPKAPGKFQVETFSNETLGDIDFFETKEEAENYVKSLKLSQPKTQLYQNLLKELEYGKGKEVLDRIKRDYQHKDKKTSFGEQQALNKEYGFDDFNFGQLENNTKKDFFGKTYIYKISDRIGAWYEQVAYSLEEQQEEAIVELLGLMTAEKLDAVKDGKLISLLKRLLKEIKAFVKDLLKQREIDIDKLPDNMTLGDLADLLAYSNSKLILPGNEVVYTTPDNQTFKTYAEASKHISELAKSVEDVDLSSVKLSRDQNNYIANTIEDVKKWLNSEIEFPRSFHGITYYKDENLFATTTSNPRERKEIPDDTVVEKFNLILDSYKKRGISNPIENFIEKNKEYEQSKEIIEAWKKVNNIQYNPEEIYSRGQEFTSVVGAYSDFDVNLMMQNLLSHIEDNEKAGGKFAISAFTKPVDKTIGHLEGGGGKIKFKIYPQSNDILWVANADVYSGSVWDASEKVNKDKKSELLGVSYTKYPSLSNVNTVQPNLANIVDNLNHHHNELGIVLTGNNFRLEYDQDIPYTTKKLINNINKILDDKYGKIKKPEIKKEVSIQKQYKFGNEIFDTYEQAKAEVDKFIGTEQNEVLGFDYSDIKEIQKPIGKQPTQTKENTTSIESVRDKLGINTPNIFRHEDFSIGDVVTIEGIEGEYKIYEFEDSDGEIGVGTTEIFYNVEPVDESTIFDPETNPEGTGRPHFRVPTSKMKKVSSLKEKEYTSQALINTKIAALKEVAKKYPRSLIRSEVKSIRDNAFSGSVMYNAGFDPDELPFQKLSSQQSIVNNLLNLQGKQEQFETYYKIDGFETELKRPSSLAKKKIQDREEFKSEKQIRDQLVYTGTGTLIHAIQGDIIRKNFLLYNNHIKALEMTPEIASLYAAIEEDPQLKSIIAEAKKEGTILMAEVFVGNLKLARGGTIDLLGVTKEGNYKLYDLKTRFTRDSNIRYRYNKIEEFTKQLGEYKKILEEGDDRLGINSGKVITSKILENKLDINLSTGRVTKINGIEFVAPFFLRTEDKKLNDFINRLQDQIKLMMVSEPKDENQKEKWEELLKSKMELMQSLQLRQDTTEIIQHASIELAAIREYLKNEDSLDTRDMESQLLVFMDINDYLEYDELTKTQQTQINNIESEAKRLYKKIMSKGKEVIVDSAVHTGNEKFVDELFSPIKDISFLRKMTMGVRDVDHPLISTAYRLIIESLTKGREKLDTLKEKLEPLIERYKNYMGSLDYSILLNDDKTSLVDKYSKEFWKQYYNNKTGFNAKWAKENLIYDEKAYDEAYANKLAFENSLQETEISKIKAWLSLREDAPTDEAEFNKYAENIYWKNRKQRFEDWFAKHEKNSYFYFTIKDKWVDPKWRELKQGKYKGTPVEEFYDFYTNYMKLANEYSPERIKPNFIANFTQEFTERALNLGIAGAIKGSWSELLNNLELKYDENLYGKTDPYTGESLNQLMIPGMSNVKQEKSLDLGKSLFIFMEGVYRYQELSTIEGTINHVKTQIKNLEESKIDSLGNLITDPTKVNSRKNAAKQVSELFNHYVDSVFYNKSRKDEGGFNFTGGSITDTLGLLKKGDTKIISYAKLVDTLIKYTGLRNLAGSVFSPMVNLLGATANQYMTGFSGMYYSNSNLAKAQNLLTAGRGFNTEESLKLRLIIDWLDIDREKIKREVFNKISANKVGQVLETYNGMALFRESEILLVESGAGAMILSNKYNITMDSFEVVDGKLKPKTEFSALDKAMFKQKVLKVNSNNIGSMNTDDVILAKKWIVGRMLMQHRSWLPPLAYNRFGKKRYDFILEKDVEGRYIVAVRAVKYILSKGYSQGIESLSPDEVLLAKEAAAEALLIIGTGLLTFALSGVDDDKKKEAWYKYSNTISGRLFNELLFFADPTGVTQFQILLSPAATTSTIEDMGKLVRDVWREGAADLYDDPEKIRKNAKPLKKSVKAFPVLSQGERFINLFYDEK